MRIGLRAAIVTGTVLAAGTAPAEILPPERAGAKTWIEGPVRYISTNDEIKIFRGLPDDAARAGFIERFWQRRDPSPNTPANEYRQLFWTRVQYANERYADGAGPGWKSDRGKLFVQCGPPDRVEDMPTADTRATPDASHGLIRWIYQGRPCGRSDLGPMVIVAFVRDTSGAYRMSSDPDLSSLYFRESDLSDPTFQRLEKWYDFIGRPGRSELSVLADLGKLQDVNRPEEVVLERVETSEQYGTHPLAVSLARFRHPQGGTLVVVTVAAPERDGGGSPGFVARFVPRDAGLRKRFVAEESFRLEGRGAARLAQARTVLAPGIWDLVVLSAETGVPTSGIFRDTFEIAPDGEALSMSDLVVARDLEPLAYASLVSWDEPYLVGAFRVVPRTGPALTRGETVHLFFEAYGGTPPYRAAFQLEGRETDGSWRELGDPVLQEGTGRQQAFGLPTGPRWPTGDYRLRATLTDAAGATAVGLAGFSLE